MNRLIPWVLSLFGGALTATAWDPWLFSPGALLGFALWWLAIILAPRPRTGAGLTSLFTIVWLAIACAWMAVFGPIAFIALFLAQGLIIVPFGLLAWWARTSRWRYLTIPAAYVVTESLRAAYPFGGFAWAQLSHSQAGTWGLANLYELVGSWGMSAVVVLTGMILGEALAMATTRMVGHTHKTAPTKTVDLADRDGTQGDYAQGDGAHGHSVQGAGLDVQSHQGRMAVGATVTALVKNKMPGIGLPLLVFIMGQGFVNPWPETVMTWGTLDVAIVQAGDVRHTFAAGISALEPKDERVVDHLTAAHRHLDGRSFDLIIWPENSLDYDPDRPGQGSLAQARDALLATVGEAMVLAGQNSDDGAGGLTNVIGVYQHGRALDRVAKAKLVPFGEFFPYPDLLGWLPSAQLIGNMVPGSGPKPIALGDHLIGSVICYESAFSTMTDQAITPETGLLVVSTNNASFGDTAMKDQHLTISRQRALEYGRPVIHGSLSGPSAIITPDGQIHQRTGYLDATAITQTIQPRTGTTPAMILNRILPILAGLVVAFALGCHLIGRFQSNTASVV